jgi:hypothetical protein
MLDLVDVPVSIALIESFYEVLLQIPGRGGEWSGECVVPGKSYAATPKME